MAVDEAIQVISKRAEDLVEIYKEVQIITNDLLNQEVVK